MQVKLISLTQPVFLKPDSSLTPEDLIAYTARVSNPSGQMNHETAPKLLRFLIRNGHWSPFEMVDMTVEIETSRGITPQILRHWSSRFQEFSQRYASPGDMGYERYRARRQDTKNRQNSIDDLPEETIQWFYAAQEELNNLAFERYGEALEKGIAKEQARFLLTLGTKTRLYRKANVRDWIFYFMARSSYFPKGVATQREHRDIADAIYDNIFRVQFPNVCEALNLS